MPEHQQHAMQGTTVVFASLGDLSVNALVNFFEEPIVHIRLIFVIAAVLYAATVSSLLVLGVERPVMPEDKAVSNVYRPPLNFFIYLRDLPGWMWRVGGTYAFGFFTFFCIQVNASTWIGSDVLGGTCRPYNTNPHTILFLLPQTQLTLQLFLD